MNNVQRNACKLKLSCMYCRLGDTRFRLRPEVIIATLIDVLSHRSVAVILYKRGVAVDTGSFLR